jgi:hypothetical protein
VAGFLAYLLLLLLLLFKISSSTTSQRLTRRGEACLYLIFLKAKSNKIGYSVNLRVMISQPARDELLLCSLINYFNCGKLYKNNNCFNLTIRKFADIDTKIIPFFFKYPFLGINFLDFKDFCLVQLMLVVLLI